MARLVADLKAQNLSVSASTCGMVLSDSFLRVAGGQGPNYMSHARAYASLAYPNYLELLW